MLITWYSKIDALSYESMTVAEPSNTIALSGISFSRLSQYLKDNSQTKHIIIMLDNDEVGISISKKWLYTAHYLDIMLC